MHVVTVAPSPFLASGGALRVLAVPAATDNLVWIAQCTRTGAAAVVDGPSAGAALAACEAHGIGLTAVWNTHTHGDHVGINRDLAARGRLAGLEVIGPARKAHEVPGITRGVDEGDVVRLGDLTARVWLTEGHLDGHVSFVFDDVVFCGDTLFAGGCGYLFDGPPDKMFRSLLRLGALPGDTRVCCAHEYTQDNLRFAWSVEPDNPALADRIRRVWATRRTGATSLPSTIAEEQATNPFLRPGSPRLVAEVAAQLGSDVDLSTPLAVFTATRRLKDTKAYQGAPEPDLAERLADDEAQRTSKGT